MELKFYVIEIATGDSKISGKGMYEYATLTEAEASFHSKLGVAMKSALYTSDLVMVIDSDGTVYRSEHYVAPTVAEVTE